MSKKIVILPLLAGLLLSPFTQKTSASVFSDVDGNKNQIAIEWLVDHDVLDGYSDGTFKPDQPINRAELIKILVEAQTDPIEEGSEQNCFADVSDEWFAPSVCYAKKEGWVEGYEGNLFRPEQNVTKAEALKMLINTLGYDMSQTFEVSVFTDVDSEAWYASFVELAEEKDLLEQTSGSYGVEQTMTRGEVSENLYRALILEEYGFSHFTEYQNVLTGAEVTCDTAVQVYGDLAPEEGQMKMQPIPTCKGYRYTACTQNPVGNPDLYGGDTLLSLSQYEQKSTDGVVVSVDEDGNETSTVHPDCITFEPEDTRYYLGVYGAEADSSANIWVTSSKLQDVPKGFENSLGWFSGTCTELTNEKYGPFNTPWGNDEDAERPFYDGYPNYIHGGTDIACEPDTEVLAMCDGTIADSNDAGDDWGWHTVLECENEGETLSIAFIHLQQDSVLSIGTEVEAGDVIGKVFDLQSPGEIPHVHLTGCKGSYGECFAGRFQSDRGAARQSEWWGVRKFWFDMDWHTNPGLYASLPE